MNETTRETSIAGAGRPVGALTTPLAGAAVPFDPSDEQKRGAQHVSLTCNLLGASLRISAEELEPAMPGITARLHYVLENFDNAGIPRQLLDMSRELLHGYSGEWSAENKRARENG